MKNTIIEKIRYFIKSEDELHKETQEKLKENGFKTDKGSIVNLFSNIIMSAVSDAYKRLQSLHLSHFVSTAKGDYLDDIGLRKSLVRYENETDESLRYRIINADKFNASCNFTSIRQAILNQYKDVYDVKKIDYTQGAGSCTIYVYSNTENEELLTNIRHSVDYRLPSGVVTRIEFPQKIHLGFKIKINTTSATDSEHIDIRRNALKALEKAFANMKPNEKLNYYDVIHIIASSDNNIKSASIIDYTLDGIHSKFSQINCPENKKLILSKSTEMIF